ncbi:Nramp family divalent metal transporter [Cryptosporangium aurantiacum]|uniref:Mn2+ and Fe2+ transporters of the NRAMP family n=1 Tax=Cryptosporangium aurantiacum TaxID=134849 RepID=A0A1M7R1E8_9ACTN|nr:Nramp family divalent metal transporter [Cryptosporangium aurantiacum]SHN38427.1 Mn2+ and Fe2+ transporters of the NRAMP family [Cryptosporangium aurantiacum]
MVSVPSTGGSRTSVVDRFPTKYLAAPEVRELPEPPANFRRVIGPGIIAAGVGMASGEFILYPYIASQVGLVFVWAAFVGLATQYFLNMEIERYTLATGETALTGFSRYWRHWGLVFAIMAYFANIWPGWATSSATLITYLVGGSSTAIAIGILVLIGAVLTMAPVVYQALEKIEMVKVAAVLLLIVVAAFAAIGATAWADSYQIITEAGVPHEELGFALLLGALAFAGAGGGQNLCQSNWIRDKGFGMGSYVPRIVSPVTGHPEAAPSTGYVFEPTPEHLDRWRRWWRFANLEQLSTFVLISFLTIFFTSLLAYATVYGREGLSSDISFLEAEGDVLNESVGGWFGTFFWIIGAFSLFAAALGIVDYTSRLGADVLRTAYLKTTNESRIYFALVWGLVTIGVIVLLSGLTQPLILLVISAVTGGLMMFMYSALLLVINRRVLPVEIRPGAVRVAALIWAFLLFGVLSVLTFNQQLRELFNG